MPYNYLDMDAEDLVTWHCFKHGRVNQSIYNHLCLVCGSPMVRTSRYQLYAEKENMPHVEKGFKSGSGCKDMDEEA